MREVERRSQNASCLPSPASRRRFVRRTREGSIGPMMLARLALVGAGAWAAYAWGAHLLTPASARRGSPGYRKMALTFADGPDPDWTPRVLDVLAEMRVRASFFLVGERAARAPDTVRRIAAEGHDVSRRAGSH